MRFFLRGLVLGAIFWASFGAPAQAAGPGTGLSDAIGSGAAIIHDVQTAEDQERARRRRDGQRRRGNGERRGQRREQRQGQQGQRRGREQGQERRRNNAGQQRRRREQGQERRRSNAGQQRRNNAAQRQRAAQQARQRERAAQQARQRAAQQARQQERAAQQSQRRQQQQRLRSAEQARQRARQDRVEAEEARRRAAARSRNAGPQEGRSQEGVPRRGQRTQERAQERAQERTGPRRARDLTTNQEPGTRRQRNSEGRGNGLSREGVRRERRRDRQARERADENREGVRRRAGDGDAARADGGNRRRGARVRGDDREWRRRQDERRAERRRQRRAERRSGERQRQRARWQRPSRRVTERRTRSEWISRRELRDPQGRRRVVRSRRYWVRNRRNRNRFRRGRSVYYLPPAGAALALGAYLVSSSNAGYDTYLNTFLAPPVVDVDERYTLEEIVEDPAVRAKVRSVNLDTVNFASGSSSLGDGELERLEEIADAMLAVIARRPDEVFLIAGHTDAVGSFESNLELSEARAAAVQEALVIEYGVPAENLESVGYGEQYLLVNSQGSSRANRRVTVRAIGALMSKR